MKDIDRNINAYLFNNDISTNKTLTEYEKVIKFVNNSYQIDSTKYDLVF